MLRHIVLVAAMAAIGCMPSRDARAPGGGGGGGGGGTGPIAAEDFPEALAAAYCRYLYQCDPWYALDEFFSFFYSSHPDAVLMLRDEALCTSVLTRILEDDAPDLQALLDTVRDGSVQYDATLGRSCIDVLMASCTSMVRSWRDVPECDLAFRPTLGERGRCTLSSECETGWCDNSPPNCPGYCRPPPRFCGIAGDCVGDEVCLTPLGEERCASIAWGPDAGEGQPCGRTADTGTAITVQACAPGLWCRGDRADFNPVLHAGSCLQPVVLGPEEACDRVDATCGDDHACIAGSCRPTRYVHTAGEPCDSAAGTHCAAFLRLECVGGRCVQTSDGAAGSPCSTGDYITYWYTAALCNEGLVCHEASQTCEPRVPAGATCQHWRECQTYECESGTCVPVFCGRAEGP